MKKDKNILLTFYGREKYPIVFSVNLTMNLPEDISPKKCQKEWQEVVDILKGHNSFRRFLNFIYLNYIYTITTIQVVNSTTASNKTVLPCFYPNITVFPVYIALLQVPLIYIMST